MNNSFMNSIGVHFISRFKPAIVAVVLLYSFPLFSQDTQTKRYVVIVADNNSLDEGVTPLQFADDDGARYFELFSASGAEATLLALLDADAQTKFPRAAKTALLPTRQKLLETLQSVFEKIKNDNASGITTHFTFVYAGHGNIGPNQEGYINFLDARLNRRTFYSEIVGPSPATFNHIILDACHSYYLVNKRGAGKSHRQGDFRADIHDFLQAELLSHYPNTGVILAASQDSETHEWHRLESGIFSHELISALSGTADVNEDGVITYQEAAACVEAANTGIRIQKARLNVYFQPPANRQDIPLMNLSTFQNTAALHLEKEMGGRYYIEDSRGVRTVDLNFTKEQAVRVKLIGEEPFYLRTDNIEARMDPTNGIVESATLAFNALSENHRGSVEQSFRQHLFEVPFGLSFYLGMFAVSEHASEQPHVDVGPVDVKKAPDDRSLPPLKSKTYSILGWTVLGTGVAAGIASGVMYGAARSAYNDYNDATKRETARSLRKTTNTRLSLSRVFMGLGIGLAVAGGSVLILDTIDATSHRPSTARLQRVTPILSVQRDLGTVGFSAEF